MSEFIILQVGQCGNQIGSAFWPLVLREHGIRHHENVACSQGPRQDLQAAFHSFFHMPEGCVQHLDTLADLVRAKVTARVVCVDMEDSVVGRFTRGPLRHLFDKDCLITNYPGSGNNWAEGFHSHGCSYGDRLAGAVRRVAERCDRLHGFLMLHSLGGGTGSGLGSRLLRQLHDCYPHVDRLAACVYPAGSEDVITAPYNVALATRELLQHATCVLPVHNKALLEMCEYLKTGCSSVETSTYIAACKPFQDMNSIVVNMLLHLTSGSRFPGPLNVDMNEISTNMVPFSGLHFVSSSYSPIMLGRSVERLPARKDLCSAATSRHSQLLNIDPWSGTLLAMALVGRGSISMADMRTYVNKLSVRRRFVPWGPAVKVGLCSVPAAGHASSFLTLANSSSMATLFSEVAAQFTKLYRRKAHTHHYLKVEGFDFGDFEESEQSLLDSAARYCAMNHMQKVVKPRMQVLV